jgi:hypothetical protein
MYAEWSSRSGAGGSRFWTIGSGSVGKFWKYTLVGAVVSVVVGWALYLFSGDVIVVLFVRAVGKVVSIVLGLIELKSH